MTGAVGEQIKIALVGNPNVGKTTLFNALTGMRQHTGNWPGKTVGKASGTTVFRGQRLELIDLPGTYSLDGASADEQITAEYIALGESACTIVVCDASALERTLILALQVLQRAERVVVCINLMDEAYRRGIQIDGEGLEKALGVPVVLTAAGKRKGLSRLLERVVNYDGEPVSIDDPVKTAEELADLYVKRLRAEENWRLVLDRILVSRRYGVPLLMITLFLIIWITVRGANYPSSVLESLFNWCYFVLQRLTSDWPWWLRGSLIDGVYLTAVRVMSVMLPPMAIFFPLFTILEDIGYLPRMAFLLDRPMCRCGGCGKQALTLCMGLGCNAVGVTGCRIIESPRERLHAILTNAMVPCNGRFPTLILLGSLFFPEAGAAMIVALCVILGVLVAMTTSGVLSCIGSNREKGKFLLEMPPFRRPQIGQILIRSLLDRTLTVAGRALAVAAPAGLVLWIMANTPLLGWLAWILEPVGKALGMNGIIFLAFCLAIPANELVIPVILMALTGEGCLAALSDATVLSQSGWTWQMAVCTMVFTLFHWPCSTTLITVYQETKSAAKTAAAFFLPTAVGCFFCVVLNLIFQNLGG